MNRNFKLLLGGQLVSQLGDKFHMIALAFWVLDTTGSSAKMGAVLAASLVPVVILGLFSGAFSDRYSRKVIIVGTDVVRGGILLVFAWLMATGQMNFHIVLILQVVLAINTAFFDPAVPALIPNIVDKDQLGRANAIHQSVNSLATIGGAALGGMAVSALGYAWIFGLNGISFLISAGFESLIRIPRIAEHKSRNSLVADIREGYAYLFSRRLLMVVLCMVMAIHFFYGGIEVFMPVIAAGISSDGPRTLGIFHAAIGGGFLAMSLLLSRISMAGKEQTALFFSVAAMGLVQMLTWFVARTGDRAVLGFTVCFFLWGAAVVRAAVAYKTLLQTYAHNAFGGRVFAAASTVGDAAVPAAMIVFGLLLDYIAFSSLLPVSGLALAGLGLTAYVLVPEDKNDAEKHSTRFPKNRARANRGAN
jgi:MFS family permease